MDKKIVYALQDPRDSTIRYIGMSCNPKVRLKEHHSSTGGQHNIAKTAWVKELKSQGLRAKLVVLEDVTYSLDPHGRENFYMDIFRSTVFNKAPSEWSRKAFRVSQSRLDRYNIVNHVKTPIVVTYPDNSTKTFPSIVDAARELGLKTKRIDEQLRGFKNRGKGKLVKVLQWKGHRFSYAP